MKFIIILKNKRNQRQAFLKSRIYNINKRLYSKDIILLEKVINNLKSKNKKIILSSHTADYNNRSSSC